MKKVFITVAISFALLVGLSACGNRQFIDTTWTYNYAIISLPNGEYVEGKLESWRDYKDSDAVQVIIDGKSYYTFIDNVVLINE